ncbi:thermonuclease family protein [Azospirillum thermophilum]|uniref:Nuclease n=1 Tax=Azospirillum thermophilum TaxID=2202148 RepID=A0A2S2CTI4_9PROT|nr:thermonuclease family protein [Azospirillum thermophilum]AWK87822.1 nuclease [Azospirillum thermophilum]
MRPLAAAFAFWLAVAALPAGAAPSWRVVAVVDGDTLVLEDGRQVRLAGIEAPRPPAGAGPGDGRSWPLAEAAATALADLALGRQVSVRGEAITDRHGRLLAHLQRDDGLWLQGALLTAGLARVHTRPDSRGLAAGMLAAEEAARQAGRGLWRSRAYEVRWASEPEELARHRDSFQIVEGRVLHVQKSGGEAYLDFGEDWRTDVTVHLGRAAMRAAAEAGIDPLSFEGRRVRVRGWIGLRNGPVVEVTHPEQIERLEPPAPPPRTVRRAGPPPGRRDADAEGD